MEQLVMLRIDELLDDRNRRIPQMLLPLLRPDRFQFTVRRVEHGFHLLDLQRLHRMTATGTAGLHLLAHLVGNAAAGDLQQPAFELKSLRRLSKLSRVGNKSSWALAAFTNCPSV